MSRIVYFFCAFALLLMSCQMTTEPQLHEKETRTCVYHFDFQNFEMWTLQDVRSRMSVDLFPDVDSSLLRRLMPNGDAESAINVFLIHKNDRYFLFDTGLGSYSGGALLDNLAAIGVSPADIDVICITHVHQDHIGGLLSHDTAVFPKARVYFPEKEIEGPYKNETMRQIGKAYASRIYAFMIGGTVEGCIQTIDASGHTPGHAVYKVDELYIIGDLIHAADLQIPHPECCAIYDENPERAVATRKRIYHLLEEPGSWAAGMHLPYSGVMHQFKVIRYNKMDFNKNCKN